MIATTPHEQYGALALIVFIAGMSYWGIRCPGDFAQFSWGFFLSEKSESWRDAIWLTRATGVVVLLICVALSLRIIWGLLIGPGSVKG